MFDEDPLPHHFEAYWKLRTAIAYNIRSVLGKSDPVTLGLLWHVRETLIDMQAMMIGEGNDDPDLDERFTRMRTCIDRELSHRAIPSPTVGEIWTRRLSAITGPVRRRLSVLMEKGDAHETGA